MKLAIVCNPKDSKLREGAYCSVFKDMIVALTARFKCKCFVIGDCHADQINVDVILFFDPHASHHIKIEGIQKHPALKLEYWNDMHQQEFHGVYNTTGIKVHKLGPEQRARRAEERGTSFIVAGVRDIFHELFSQYLDTEKMLLHFPHAPAKTRNTPLADRLPEVLGNGATWGAFRDSYAFRKWAYEQPEVQFFKHNIADNATPKGEMYSAFLAQYAASLALCTVFPVPKYFEIPAAGCVTFAEYHKEYEDLGFKDQESCIYVNRDNFTDRVQAFIAEPSEYQDVADAGRKLMAENYTADHFAEFIYRKVEEEVTANA